MAKIDRKKVWEKYGGHCAYCGAVITPKEMQVDHIFPRFHSHWLDSARMMEGNLGMLNRNIDDPINLNPACRICNNWKSAFSIEQFRHEIQMQIQRLRKYSASYRMASRYGLVAETGKAVVFYFESIAQMEKGGVK